MLQIGIYCNNHLIINMFLKRLGVKAGKDSLLFAIFVTPNKEKRIYDNDSALYAPDWELSFNVRIATQTILSEVVKVVQVNNATDVRIARTVLLPSTTYKAYLPNIDNCPKRDWAITARY